jgi:hypothetical protein
MAIGVAIGPFVPSSAEFVNRLQTGTTPLRSAVMVGCYQEAEIDFIANNPGLTLFHCHSTAKVANIAKILGDNQQDAGDAIHGTRCKRRLLPG